MCDSLRGTCDNQKDDFTRNDKATQELRSCNPDHPPGHPSHARVSPARHWGRTFFFSHRNPSWIESGPILRPPPSPLDPLSNHVPITTPSYIPAALQYVPTTAPASHGRFAVEQRVSTPATPENSCTQLDAPRASTLIPQSEEQRVRTTTPPRDRGTKDDPRTCKHRNELPTAFYRAVAFATTRATPKFRHPHPLPNRSVIQKASDFFSAPIRRPATPFREPSSPSDDSDDTPPHCHDDSDDGTISAIFDEISKSQFDVNKKRNRFDTARQDFWKGREVWQTIAQAYNVTPADSSSASQQYQPPPPFVADATFGYPGGVLCTQYRSTGHSTHFFFCANCGNRLEGKFFVQW
jgi:hypothetical protein